MDLKNTVANFQFIANRISNFTLETKDMDIKGEKAKVNYDIDYNIIEIKEDEKLFIGKLEYIVVIKAKVKNKILFKIQLTMEGIFAGGKNKLSEEDFRNMIELNGIATLSHLSRAYIISATSLAGINPPVKVPMVNIHVLREMKKKKEKDE
jgi:preprotein translocase subunit SecB